MNVQVHDFHTKFHENPCSYLRVTEIRGVKDKYNSIQLYFLIKKRQCANKTSRIVYNTAMKSTGRINSDDQRFDFL